jgi:hypothetical protein
MTSLSKPKQFVLQGFDPITGAATVEARASIADLVQLRRILGEQSDDDPDLARTYYLSGDEVIAIGKLCDPPFSPSDLFTAIEPWHSIRDVPYLVHTNFELPLMLESRKPMAMFCDLAEWLREYLAPFAPFVVSRQLVRREIQAAALNIDQPASGPDSVLNVYFALPGQEWRIDAHIMLRRVAAKSGWNDSLERFEGSLLGYEDWQNDWWIAQRKKRIAN